MSVAEVALPGGETLALDDRRWNAIAAKLPASEIRPVRLVYAATHVVMKPGYARIGHRPDWPGRGDEIAEWLDWDGTLALRRELAAHGFGIAEAMDTAQRFCLGWEAARELIERCGQLDLPNGFVAGAGTDHLPEVHGRRDLIDGVAHQCEVIRRAGGIPMILPMPWLSLNRCDPDDYLEVYGEIIRAANGPLFVHWLGPMFLPSLDGYFPGDTFERVMRLDPEKVRGAKLSLLDPELEIRLRRSLWECKQIMLTGDDFHFAELIAGDGAPPDRWIDVGGQSAGLGEFSHGLLGVFDAIAEPANLALRCLAVGNLDDYDRIMGPCEELGRKVFEEPTRRYKTGLAFLAWINGRQENAMLVNHEERCRDRTHLLEVIRLANAAGAITDASVAAERIAAWLREPRAS